MIKNIFDTYGAPVLLGIFILLFILEEILPLRARVQNRWKRIIINSIISIPAFLLLRLLFMPAVVWLAFKNQEWQFGIGYVTDLPVQVKAVLTFLLLDYGNYIWHILLHRLPIMWRFHLVHHTDLDLDVTTAFRFHFGELIASVFFRGIVIIVIGVSPLVVLVYEIVFEAATQFHHSNMKLSTNLENVFNKFLVTPRMHGIHHSIINKETNSNFSVVFSFWDLIHKTMRLNVRQQNIVIGDPAYRNENELTARFLLKLPFMNIRKIKL